jgi:lipopolysaccharide transport system permease protein
MLEELREFYKYRNLLVQLVVRDLKVRYKNSVLGFFWSLANPLVQVATITVIVKYVMGIGIPNYSAYLLVGYLPWVFFQMALLDSSDTILVHHRDLLKKVYFPREVLPISAVIANLIHYLLALVVFFAYLLFYFVFLHGSPIMPTVIFLPVLMVLQLLLILGLSCFISCLNTFYEDTKYILVVLLNVMFYITPIMYPAELVHDILPPAYREVAYRIYLLNPVAMLIDAYRKILLPPFEGTIKGKYMTALPLDYTMLGVCAIICVLVAVSGYAYFNKRKWEFAERA